MTWADAELHCEELGGTLAAITTQDESSSIFAWLANEGVATGSVWIGGNDIAVEGTWEWSTGEELLIGTLLTEASSPSTTACAVLCLRRQSDGCSAEFRCPQDWIRIDLSCYHLATGRMTWADAELHCEEQGGTLAAITNQEESSSIFAWLANEGVVTGFVWIGGNDHAVEGTWEWSTAEEFAFEEMSKTSEPNGSTGENCLAIYMNRAGWADLALYLLFFLPDRNDTVTGTLLTEASSPSTAACAVHCLARGSDGCNAVRFRELSMGCQLIALDSSSPTEFAAISEWQLFVTS
ncbi:LECG-like protein [Mya arenaria]|uniref:LECG-like protein n=1 Tax=Mya arenaria TaxID=6604 RepID=A0ABY7FGA7_MYAAR|nr:LECG-like protein [Mya arenaria]